MVETEYEIRGTDDSLFCKMQRTGTDVVLKTATSSITLTNLASQITSPKSSRGKRGHRKKSPALDR